MSEKWYYCPECGSEEICHEDGDHKQCANCHQEWWTDIDYSDVVQKHLGKNYCDWQTTVERKDAALAALIAENERLNHCLIWEQNRANRIGTHGPGCESWGPVHYECLLRKFTAMSQEDKSDD